MRAISIINVYETPPKAVVQTVREESFLDVLRRERPQRTMLALAGELPEELRGLIGAALDAGVGEPATIIQINGHAFVVRTGGRR